METPVPGICLQIPGTGYCQVMNDPVPRENAHQTAARRLKSPLASPAGTGVPCTRQCRGATAAADPVIAAGGPGGPGRRR
jgi:hypothetical protein